MSVAIQFGCFQHRHSDVAGIFKAVASSGAAALEMVWCAVLESHMQEGACRFSVNAP